jgi:hypothetical protein
MLVTSLLLVAVPAHGQDPDPDERRGLGFYGERNRDYTTFIDTITVDRYKDNGNKYRSYVGISEDGTALKPSVTDTETRIERVGPDGEEWSVSISTRGEERHVWEASEDGSHVVVYAYDRDAYEDYTPSLRALVNRNGEIVAEDDQFHHMSPSGTYYYGSNTSYTSEEVIIRTDDLQTATVQSWVRQTVGVNTDSTSYNYRIVSGDVLVLTSFTDASEGSSRQYSRSEIYVLDLAEQEIIAEFDNLSDGLPRFSILYDEVEQEGKYVFMPSLDESMRLLIVNLNTGQRRVTSIRPYSTFQTEMTGDGPAYVIRRGPQVTVKDAETSATLRQTTLEDGRSFYLGSFTSADGGEVRVVENAPDLPELVYQGPGGQQARVYGWFDLEEKIGYVPLIKRGSGLAINRVDLTRL